MTKGQKILFALMFGLQVLTMWFIVSVSMQDRSAARSEFLDVLGAIAQKCSR